MAYAWEERVLKGHASVFVRESASINILMLVEPAFQPITSLAQPRRQVVWHDVKCAGRDSMWSSRFMFCPPEHQGSEDDDCSHNYAAEFPGNEAKQQGDDHSKRNGPEYETRCQRHTNQTQYQKTDSDKQSGKLRVQLHHPPRTGMPFGIVIFHWLIVPLVQVKNHLEGLWLSIILIPLIRAEMHLLCSASSPRRSRSVRHFHHVIEITRGCEGAD